MPPFADFLELLPPPAVDLRGGGVGPTSAGGDVGFGSADLAGVGFALALLVTFEGDDAVGALSLSSDFVGGTGLDISTAGFGASVAGLGASEATFGGDGDVCHFPFSSGFVGRAGLDVSTVGFCASACGGIGMGGSFTALGANGVGASGAVLNESTVGFCASACGRIDLGGSEVEGGVATVSAAALSCGVVGGTVVFGVSACVGAGFCTGSSLITNLDDSQTVGESSRAIGFEDCSSGGLTSCSFGVVGASVGGGITEGGTLV